MKQELELTLVLTFGASTEFTKEEYKTMIKKIIEEHMEDSFDESIEFIKVKEIIDIKEESEIYKLK